MFENLDPKKPGSIFTRETALFAGLIIATLLIVWFIFANKPDAAKFPSAQRPVLQVNVVQARPQDYVVKISSYGNVQARTRGHLVTQVSGEIVMVSPDFKAGGFFERDQVLLQIDDRDYKAALLSAQAALAQAEATLAQEKANAEQAKKDWQSLGNRQAAPDLVLRKPQLAAARAQYDSARAALAVAELNLARTQVRVPYTGRVISKQVALGQYVSANMTLAEVFATDVLEVRLPLSLAEYGQLGLTEELQQVAAETPGKLPVVTLSSQIGDQLYQWRARVTHADSAFDTATRQIYVTATINDPFAQHPHLKIGQYMTAELSGRVLSDVIVMPAGAVREGRYVYVVEQDILKRKTVNILWRDSENVVIGPELNAGEQVVVTALGSAITGSPVKVANVLPENDSGSVSRFESNSDREKAVQ